MKTSHETIEDRLKRNSKLDPNTGCLIWIGTRGGGGGYGTISVPGKGRRCVHVLAWEYIYGPRPEGCEIRRTCGNKLCVNVRHLVLFKVSAERDDIECQLERLKRRMIVDPITGCWEWQGNKTLDGYGQIPVKGNSVYAHRLMWECVYGETKGLQVLHKCDNPCCIRPSHLFLGTNADNMRDKVLKDRAGIKLNIEEVKDIRTSKLSPKDLAKKYEVKRATIYRILNRRTWKHVE